jgi:membrane-associated protein
MIGGISEWILSLDGWVAIAVVFLFPALESSAFLGFVFPGEIAVLLGGVLASKGSIPLPAVIVAAIAGAVIGDMVGYFVGRRWGHQILRGAGRRMPFVRHRIDDHLESARSLLQRRGGAAVFLGRFTAALQPELSGSPSQTAPSRRTPFGGVLRSQGSSVERSFAYRDEDTR